MKKNILLFLVIALLLSSCGNTAASSKLSGSKVKSSKNITGNSQTATAGAIDKNNNNASDQSSGNKKKASDFDPSDIDVDITENMYVAYINEIYVNTEDYLGKTIRIQGMFQACKDEKTEKTYYYVYRTGPGCCGNDGSMCGFEFTWDGDMPKDNDWIEVVGKLRSYDEDGFTYLTLDAKAVTVMDERGAETVYQ